MVTIANIHIHTSELPERVKELHAGSSILLSGVIYTARDAAHKRLFALLDDGKPLPFPLKGSTIYFAGPTPNPPGKVIGSCGPTTSGRMDPYTPRLMDLGLCCTIGKGERNEQVKQAIVRNSGLYLCAIGGAGALAAQCITSCEVIAFEDLGCESIKKLEIKEFPLIVAIDAEGRDIFRRNTI